MKTVYIVTSGEYEDYGIHVVFSTKQDAEAHIADKRFKFMGDPRIEEWDLNEKSYTKPPMPVWWRVALLLDPAPQKPPIAWVLSLEVSKNTIPEHWPKVGEDMYAVPSMQGRAIAFGCKATTEEEAIQKAKDYRDKWVAEHS